DACLAISEHATECRRNRMRLSLRDRDCHAMLLDANAWYRQEPNAREAYESLAQVELGIGQPWETVHALAIERTHGQSFSQALDLNFQLGAAVLKGDFVAAEKALANEETLVSDESQRASLVQLHASLLEEMHLDARAADVAEAGLHAEDARASY